MSNKEIIKNLRDDKKYYGDYGKKWLSNSDVYKLLHDEEQYGCKTKVTDKMIRGSYFHTLCLEPKKKDTYLIWDQATRGKAYKEFLVENGLDPEYDIAITSREVEQVEEQAEWFLDKNNPKTNDNTIADKSVYEYITDKKAKTELPGIEKIFNVDMKGKADLVSNGIILDYKTMDNVKRFPQAVKFDSSYDTQAFIYQSIFKLPLVFIAVGNIKKTRKDGTKYYEMGVHPSTDEVLLRGKQKTQEAVSRYLKHKEGTRNIESFIYNTILT